MRSLKTNIYFKLGSIVLLALLLLIPTAMIEELVHEREYTRMTAIEEVSAKWGNAQIIAGPYLTIPYTRYIVQENTNLSRSVTESREHLYILPADLTVQGELTPQTRERGIYKVAVYQSNIAINGRFELPDLSAIDVPLEDLEFDKAELAIGIRDLRGIEKQVTLNWNNAAIPFGSGVPTKDVVWGGLSADVAMTNDSNNTYTFAFELDLKGSQQLFFVPVGKETSIDLKSTWQNPSFNGAFLPDTHHVDAAGFNAHWAVLDLNRNYPQWWTNQQHALEESAFGVDLLLPIDDYQKTYRSIRYAILFIGLTFMVFFFIEVMRKVTIHPIQYLLVGIALVVFYTLLLSISEHLNFNAAFAIAASATLVLIGSYMFAVLRSRRLTTLITGILTVLYGFIYIVIQLQDFALLMGSIGIFLIIALTMYFSRKIDWSNVTFSKSENTQG
jgi:inner membrane protein